MVTSRITRQTSGLHRTMVFTWSCNRRHRRRAFFLPVWLMMITCVRKCVYKGTSLTVGQACWYWQRSIVKRNHRLEQTESDTIRAWKRNVTARRSWNWNKSQMLESSVFCFIYVLSLCTRYPWKTLRIYNERIILSEPLI